MKIKPIYAALAAVAIIFIGIGITKLTGDWVTESEKVPIRIASGELAGMYDPADIRGSYTFGDVAASFPVTAEALAAAFALEGVEGEPGSIRLNELETYYGEIEGADGTVIGEIGTDSVRWFVSLIMEYDYIPEETTLLPSPAVAYIQNLGLYDAEEMRILREHAISPAEALQDAGITGEAAVHDETASANMIKGNTTFADLYSMGITREDFIEIAGIEPGGRTLLVRDYLSSNGLEFGTVKAALQALVDAGL